EGGRGHSGSSSGGMGLQSLSNKPESTIVYRAASLPPQSSTNLQAQAKTSKTLLPKEKHQFPGADSTKNKEIKEPGNTKDVPFNSFPTKFEYRQPIGDRPSKVSYQDPGTRPEDQMEMVGRVRRLGRQVQRWWREFWSPNTPEHSTVTDP